MAKTVRLTNAMRDDIRAKLIEHRFGEEEKSLVAEAMALGPRVYDALMGEHKAAALALPDGFVKRSRRFVVSLPAGESHFDTGWDGNAAVLVISKRSYRYHPVVLPDALPLPEDKWPHPLRKEDAVFAEIDGLNLRAVKLVEARNEMNEKLTATLGAFTTVNKLVEAWPEVLPFCPSTSEFAAPFLPAVPTDELNKALNLKPKEQEDDE